MPKSSASCPPQDHKVEIAVELVSTEELPNLKASSASEGRLYCVMPLSFTETRLPIHVNARFQLQSDRRELMEGVHVHVPLKSSCRHKELNSFIAMKVPGTCTW